LALVTGITGQDGSYLAELLLEKGYMAMVKLQPSLTHKESITFIKINMKLHVNFNCITVI
jgi:GDPmannose 4,6-dehydratase